MNYKNLRCYVDNQKRRGRPKNTWTHNVEGDLGRVTNAKDRE